MKATASDFKKGWIQQKVQQILTDTPRTRDNDEVLCQQIWYKQLAAIPADPLYFLHHYGLGQLASAGVITRARRLIQKEHPELRGDNYETRQIHSAKVARTINNDADPNAQNT